VPVARLVHVARIVVQAPRSVTQTMSESAPPSSNGTNESMTVVRAREIWLRPVLCWGLSVMVLLSVGALLGLRALIGPLPPLDGASSHIVPSSLVLDRSGRVLYEILDPQTGSHRPTLLEDIPVALRQAVVATEDASFYTNPGLDLRGIVRALITNLRAGEIRAGGSTITQQVARNLLLDSGERGERTWRRKLREAVLAWRLTRALPKDDILALYLNHVYFGSLAYGVEAAANVYFGKPVSQLSLAECAMLAGLPQAPAAHNPLADLSAAKARQAVVLQRMVREGYISAERAEQALREPLAFAGQPFAVEAPHFCMYVIGQVEELLGPEVLRSGGLLIHTTLDLDVQRSAESHVTRHLEALRLPDADGPGHNVHNAAVVVLEPSDGAIRAMVGSPDYFDAQISGAVNAALALRQPGSAIKPLTYAAAYERGWSPASVILDVPSSFTTAEAKPYRPVNYDHRFHGPVSLRTALANSYNVAAVRLLDAIGVDALLDVAGRLGVTTLTGAGRYGLALTLGGGEVRLLDLTAAYAVFATGGLRSTPYAVERVEALTGDVLYRHLAERPVRVLDERVAYLVTDVLADADARIPAFGAGSPLHTPYGAAVKTGTTTEWRDNWTVGYTSAYVTGVWVGNADNTPMRGVSGVSGAAPIWQAIMNDLHANSSPAPFDEPQGLVHVEVCAQSGALPGPACPHRREELFLPESVPTATCTMHSLVELDAATGLRATADTPPERKLVRRVTHWPAEALLWAEEQGLTDGHVSASLEARAAEPPGGGGSRASGHRTEVGTPGMPRLVNPAANSTFCVSEDLKATYQRIEVAAIVPEDALGQAELLVDGMVWHRWTGPPYRAFWPLSPGEHELSVRLVDSQGNLVTGPSIRITVLAACQDERMAP